MSTKHPRGTRIVNVFAFFALVLAVGCAADRHASLSSASSPAPGTPPQIPHVEPAAIHRQFDFWLGEWVVTNPEGQQVGTSRIESIENGFAIAEYWTSALGPTGRSINYVDPVDGAWKQVWVSSRGNVTYYVGEFRDGAMQFTGRSTNMDGANEIARASFTPQPDGSVRQFIEHSRDGGMSWFVYFDGTYRRQARQ